MIQTIAIGRVAHIGVRRATSTVLSPSVEFWDVSCRAVRRATTLRSSATRRAFNPNSADLPKDILMDVVAKYPGYTYVGSVPATIAALKPNDKAGVIKFGEDGGISVIRARSRS